MFAVGHVVHHAVMMAVSAATKKSPGPPRTKQADDRNVKRRSTERTVIEVEVTIARGSFGAMLRQRLARTPLRQFADSPRSPFALAKGISRSSFVTST